MAFDTGLARRVREALEPRQGLTERRMFGGPACMIEGKMFVGVQDDFLMGRVGTDRHADALAQPHVRAMDFTGRPMRGYVCIAPPGLVDDARLQAWAGWCADHAVGLPARKPRAKPRP